MREILFRGKREDNGEWIYGDLRHDKSLIIAEQGYETVKMWRIVIPETVGQFTGLKDKNGNKIFEGDIIKMRGGCFAMDIREYDIICKVAYGKKGYGSEIGFTGCYASGSQVPLMLEGALTVIGNIHDNPELLEVDQ